MGNRPPVGRRSRQVTARITARTGSARAKRRPEGAVDAAFRTLRSGDGARAHG